jgi:hypothetical protein
MSTKNPYSAGRNTGCRIGVRNTNLELALFHGLDFVVATDDNNVFADEFLDVFSASAGGGQGALNFFSVHFDDEGFAVFVERLEFAGVGDGFAAASLAGGDGKADESEGAEDRFHRFLTIELLLGDFRKHPGRQH